MSVSSNFVPFDKFYCISSGGLDYTTVGPVIFTFNATVNRSSFDVPLKCLKSLKI